MIDSIIDPRDFNGKRIGLYSSFHRKFVVAEDRGNSALNASRDHIGEWETFSVDAVDSETMALKALANDKYVTAENAGNNALIARATSIGDWERFRIVQQNDYTFALQSIVNNRYIRVPDGTGSALIADRLSIGDYEQFNIAWIEIDLHRAVTAFAVNFPDKVKGHTLGILRPSWGILFHTERIIENKLWFYEAFPKTDAATFPDGYQHVWNGVLFDEDGQISADCTIPYKQQGALWWPPIPRMKRRQPVGVTVKSKLTTIIDTQIDTNNQPVSETRYAAFGKMYPPIMVDLSDQRSEANIGPRWVLEIGFADDSERWAVDLGPKIGIFQPRFGMVGYHAGGGAWDDKRYFANIQSRSINEHRRHDGHPQRFDPS